MRKITEVRGGDIRIVVVVDSVEQNDLLVDNNAR